MRKDAPTAKLRVKAVARTCQGCPIQDRARHLGLCSLCCSLVSDRDGSLYVALVLLDGDNGWQQVDPCRLSPVPRLLR